MSFVYFIAGMLFAAGLIATYRLSNRRLISQAAQDFFNLEGPIKDRIRQVEAERDEYRRKYEELRLNQQ